jgi:hypothetical protein
MIGKRAGRFITRTGAEAATINLPFLGFIDAFGGHPTGGGRGRRKLGRRKRALGWATNIRGAGWKLHTSRRRKRGLR